jgi:hypothetical protein
MSWPWLTLSPTLAMSLELWLYPVRTEDPWSMVTRRPECPAHADWTTTPSAVAYTGEPQGMA